MAAIFSPYQLMTLDYSQSSSKLFAILNLQVIDMVHSAQISRHFCYNFKLKDVELKH
jgi:hypothetical protein